MLFLLHLSHIFISLYKTFGTRKGGGDLVGVALRKRGGGGEGIDEYAKNLVIKKVSLQKFSGRGQSRGCN